MSEHLGGMMKYKIIGIHEDDIFYSSKDRLIGIMVSLVAKVYESTLSANYQECTLDMGNGERLFFVGVRLSPIPLEE